MDVGLSIKNAVRKLTRLKNELNTISNEIDEDIVYLEKVSLFSEGKARKDVKTKTLPIEEAERHMFEYKVVNNFSFEGKEYVADDIVEFDNRVVAKNNLYPDYLVKN